MPTLPEDYLWPAQQQQQTESFARWIVGFTSIRILERDSSRKPKPARAHRPALGPDLVRFAGIEIQEHFVIPEGIAF
jgi:hypothetical protein